ncbi:NtaA/DmoA family FMN-dependent monooxygenase [Rhodococcus opacus]|uniref:NtaA/DmoA family FMN-dependent monooxygenase n=1 Tax=Rhodococcus opacus TaxID=37919 RepID=UPI002236046A|nr:NtaA/DmoA family FMN-dependent monooxygenase [Rhodococcus opacus]UZG55090.1 NtaA/DmoA family FMN-dependent monooxygenase [Rhodococcus opacus]
MTTPIHFGFFSSFSPPAWQAGSDRMYGSDWWSGEYHARLAQRAEDANFDFMFFEDTAAVSTTVGGSLDMDLRYALSAPKNDPVALLSYLAGKTTRLGLISTASTTLYPPFLLARLYSTIDNLSRGRAGWNIVTSSENESAQNFGLDALPPTNERYQIAEEFLEVVRALWNSWDEDAVVRDQENNVYTDPTKVRAIDHRGKHFKVRGPLNSLPSPQRTPVFAQAGGSPRGRDFAAQNAELIMSTTIGGVEAMKAFREDIHGRMKKFGRDPKECKIMYATHLYVAESRADFRSSITDSQLLSVLGKHSAHLGVDLNQFPLDEPFPQDVVANGTTSMVESLKEKGRRGQSLRDAIIDFNWGDDELGLVGPASDVAQNLVSAMEEAEGDGYIIMATQDANESHLSGIFDGVVPELKRLGAMRTDYSGNTLRENLFAF